jgi:hypothetical protein
MDKDEPIYDKPDIVIEFNNTKTVILDAKNSILEQANPAVISDKWIVFLTVG